MLYVPQNYPAAYKLAYNYTTTGFWVPVHVFMSYVASTGHVESSDLSVWFLFLDTQTHQPTVVYKRRGYDYGLLRLEVESAQSDVAS